MKKRYFIWLLLFAAVLAGCKAGQELTSSSEYRREETQSENEASESKEASKDYTEELKQSGEYLIYEGKDLSVSSLTITEKSIAASICNESGQSFGYNGTYLIEEKSGNDWVTVARNEIDYEYRKLAMNEKMSIFLPASSGLKGGTYRFGFQLKDVAKDRVFYVVTEFTVSDDGKMKAIEETQGKPITFADYEWITIEGVEISDLEIGNDNISFTLTNHSSNVLLYGKGCRIEKKDEGLWVRMKTSKNVDTEEIILALEKGESVQVVLPGMYDSDSVKKENCHFLLPVVKDDVSYFMPFEIS